MQRRRALDSDDDKAPLDIDKIVEDIVRSEQHKATTRPRKSIVQRVKTTASDMKRSFRRSRSTVEHKRLYKYE